MRQKLDMEKIAKGLGARRVGPVRSSAGYFGALQLAAEVDRRRRQRGGRAARPGDQVPEVKSRG